MGDLGAIHRILLWPFLQYRPTSSSSIRQAQIRPGRDSVANKSLCPSAVLRVDLDSDSLHVQPVFRVDLRHRPHGRTTPQKRIQYHEVGLPQPVQEDAAFDEFDRKRAWVFGFFRARVIRDEPLISRTMGLRIVPYRISPCRTGQSRWPGDRASRCDAWSGAAGFRRNGSAICPPPRLLKCPICRDGIGLRTIRAGSFRDHETLDPLDSILQSEQGLQHACHLEWCPTVPVHIEEETAVILQSSPLSPRNAPAARPDTRPSAWRRHRSCRSRYRCCMGSMSRRWPSRGGLALCPGNHRNGL